MSNIALGSKPFANKILEKCSGQQIQQLLNLVNNPGPATTVYLYGNQQLLNSSHIGITYVQLMIDPLTMRYLYGYLIYIDSTHCGFFSFVSETSPMIEIEIDPETLSYEYQNEMLSSAEFRRSIIDLLVEAGEGGNIVAKIETNNITGLTKAQLDSLEPGDVINKITGSDVHSYRVSYKGSGICLTYTDAGYMETVSYDKSGSNWVYNSTDVVNVGNVVANPTLSGSESDLTGLQVGDTKYKVGGGGSKLYRLDIRTRNNDGDGEYGFNPLKIVTDNPNIAIGDNLKEYLQSCKAVVPVSQEFSIYQSVNDSSGIPLIIRADGSDDSSPYSKIFLYSYIGSDSVSGLETRIASSSLSAPSIYKHKVTAVTVTEL